MKTALNVRKDFRGLPILTIRATSLALALSLVAVAAGQTTARRRDVSFKLRNVSIWENAASAFDYSFSVGPKWNTSGSYDATFDLGTPAFDIGTIHVPAVSLGRTGGEFFYSAEGALGLDLVMSYKGGAANVDCDGDLEFRYTQLPKPGEECEVKVVYKPRNSSFFTTTSPTLALGGMLNLGVTADAQAAAWAFDSKIMSKRSLVGGPIYYPNLGIVRSRPLGSATGNVQDLNDTDILKTFNKVSPIGMEFVNPVVETRNGEAPYDAKFGLMTSTGYSPVLKFDTSIVDLMTFIVGNDILSYVFKGEFGPYNFPGGEFGADWEFLRVAGTGSVGLRHDFKFAPAPKVKLNAYTQSGTPINLKKGDVTINNTEITLEDKGTTFKFIMPAEGSVSIVGFYNPNPTLTNVLKGAVQGGFEINPVHVAAQGKLAGKDLDWTYEPFKYVWNSKAYGTPAFTTQTVRPTVDWLSFPALTIAPVVPNEMAGTVGNDVGEDSFTLPAYAGYTPNGDGIGQVIMTVQATNGGVFCGDQARNLRSLRENGLIEPRWDGRLLTGNEIRMDPDYTSRTFINMFVDGFILRPGRHTLSFKTKAYFGNEATPRMGSYDIIVNVPTPTPNIDDDLLHIRQDRSDNEGVNYLDDTYKGESIYFESGNALLETVVVLDDNIVLPTTRYFDGQAVTEGGGDRTHPTFTDQQELRWIRSGNTVMSFSVPPALVRQLAGKRHTIKLRTTKPPTQDGDASYVLSDSLKTLDFVAGRPTINVVKYNERTSGGGFPLTKEGYSLAVLGTGYTANTTAKLTVGNQSWPLDIEVVDDTKIKVDLPKEALDVAQGRYGSATLAITTPPFTVDQGHGFNTLRNNQPIYNGGTATASFDLVPLTPEIAGVIPARPVRGMDTHFEVKGTGFSSSSIANGTTKVFLGNVPAQNVVLYGTGRELKGIGFDFTAADLGDTTGPRTLKFVNDGKSATFDIEVANSAPVVRTAVIRVRESGSAMVNVSGGLFYPAKGSKILVNGKVFTATGSATAMSSPYELAFLPAGALTADVSVLTDPIGGGQSRPIQAAISDGNLANVNVVLGNPVRTNPGNPVLATYSQSVTLTYNGTRGLNDEVLLKITGLRNATVTNSDGLVDGVPTRKVKANLRPGASMTFDVTFVGANGAAPTWTPVLTFP